MQNSPNFTRDIDLFEHPQPSAPRPDEVAPEESAEVCAECGLLFAAADMEDSCDSCGAPRCRSCALRAGDSGGVYICTTCATDLDPF